MRIVMVGAGYVGAVSGACLADFWSRGRNLCRGRREFALKSLRSARGPCSDLQAETDELSARQSSGRPALVHDQSPKRRGVGRRRSSSPSARLRWARSARPICISFMTRLATIGKIIKKDFTVVVVKSTVPIGARRRRPAHHREACASRLIRRCIEIRNTARRRGHRGLQATRVEVVIGVEDDRAREGHGGDLPAHVRRNGGRIVYTSRRSSEMIKYAANVFLAMKSDDFINEIADLCERLGADVLDVSHGIGLDDHIGRRSFSILTPELRRVLLAFPRIRWR